MILHSFTSHLITIKSYKNFQFLFKVYESSLTVHLVILAFVSLYYFVVKYSIFTKFDIKMQKSRIT